MSLTVYSYPNHPSTAYKILIAAQFSGNTVEVLSHEDAPEVVTQNAYAKVRNYDSRWPVLVTESGPIWGANAGARYVSLLGAPHLLGADQDDFTRSKIDQWIDFTNNEVQLPVSTWVYPHLGLFQSNPDEIRLVRRASKNALRIVDEHLQNNTFLVGERISLADISLFSVLHDLYLHVVGEKFAQKFRSLTRWFLTVANTNEAYNVIGTPEWKANAYFDSLKAKIVSLPAAEGSARSLTEESGAKSNDHHGKQVSLAKQARQDEFKQAKALVAAQQLAVQMASRPSKKLTEKDLNNKAFPSIYEPAPKPHEKIPKGATAQKNIRAINQPK
jgi:elongation factor 1-gamma